jgi:hypothetical protein
MTFLSNEKTADSLNRRFFLLAANCSVSRSLSIIVVAAMVIISGMIPWRVPWIIARRVAGIVTRVIAGGIAVVVPEVIVWSVIPRRRSRIGDDHRENRAHGNPARSAINRAAAQREAQQKNGREAFHFSSHSGEEPRNPWPITDTTFYGS